MARYDIILLDADMTLFDFERSEKESLHRTLQTHGLDCTAEVEATYLKSTTLCGMPLPGAKWIRIFWWWNALPLWAVSTI